MHQPQSSRYYPTQFGFTLIEVLIALAIMSIAMTAVIKATSQSIRSTLYLQEKTIATWVALQAINEARAGVLVIPEGENTVEQTTTFLGQEWTWQASSETTPNKHIRKIMVNVLREAGHPDSAFVNLESYIMP